MEFGDEGGEGSGGTLPVAFGGSGGCISTEPSKGGGRVGGGSEGVGGEGGRIGRIGAVCGW